MGIGDSLPSSSWRTILLLFWVMMMSWLLIAEIPMFALKFKHWGWRGNEVKYIFVLTTIPLVLLLGWIGVAVVIVWYVLLSMISSKLIN